MLNGYLHIGHGPNRIMAMGGWFGDAGDWVNMANAFDPGVYSFALFDYRGYGKSKHLTGEYTFEESARDAVRLAEHLGWDRFSLLGHSMGGVAIQRVMLAAPERIERMIAVTAVPACSSRMDAQRLAMFESAVTDIEKREFIINFSTGSRLPKTWIRQMARRSMEGSTPEAFAGYLKQWATVDFSELVQGNQTPVEIVIGEFDPTLTENLMRTTWLSWYPKSNMTSLSNTGHYPMYEVPLTLAATIQKIMQQT